MGFDISLFVYWLFIIKWNNETNEIKFISCSNYKPTKNGKILDRLSLRKIFLKK